MEFGKDLGFQNIILEGDTLDIVQILQKEYQSWSRYGNLIEDLKTLLNSLMSWHVHHVKREANTTAHCLANVTLEQASEQIWIEEYLTVIHEIVRSEIIYNFS